MAVKIVVHPFLNNGKELEVLTTGATVGECIKELINLHPHIEEKLFDKNKKLRGYVEILVNAKSTYPQELSYPVNDGDTINLIVFLSGG
ncbi:MAG: MoaD/ThiS family protein [Desulfobacterota bacterium]|nr:MoaD/ThiS family protein [Thermodesulfobacteriota bacterium]MDW8001204.1 MoaD/ThiS family protein [Deltaproteobacteria bacterium]